MTLQALFFTKGARVKRETDHRERLDTWGQDPARLTEEPEEYLYGLTGILNELGVEVGLATVCVRTRHPQLDMLVLRWRPLEIEEVPTDTTASIVWTQTTKRTDGVQDIYSLVHGHSDEAMYLRSPFFRAIEDQDMVRVALRPPPDPMPFPIIEDLMERGMTDYVVFPLEIGPMATAALSLTTRREGGFSTAFLEAFNEFLPLLALSTAYKVERFQFREVLRAYIGTEPAGLVLAGQIKRGDLISKRTVIGFADLRGFTAASERLPVEEVAGLVGTFFELVGQVVYGAGGEILKFMGDGVLFIVGDQGSPEATCDRALVATHQLDVLIGGHNKANPDQVLGYGCALHFGEVLYGNIGSLMRLDFTVLGPDVNLTSRIESLSGQVGEACLLSQAFAELTTLPVHKIGDFPLKGIETDQPVFAPAPYPAGTPEAE